MTHADPSSYYFLLVVALFCHLGKFGLLLGFRWQVKTVCWLTVCYYKGAHCWILFCNHRTYAYLSRSDFLSVVALCNFGNRLLLDHWLEKRPPIEQLYVIVKMLISCFCSECTIGCCHLAYREWRKLRPQMRKIQTLDSSTDSNLTTCLISYCLISCTELVWATPIYK